jgi:hypothetical protein
LRLLEFIRRCCLQTQKKCNEGNDQSHSVNPENR